MWRYGSGECDPCPGGTEGGCQLARAAGPGPARDQRDLIVNGPGGVQPRGRRGPASPGVYPSPRPRSDAGPAPQEGLPENVVLIEYCDGVQVGHDNHMYSCYRLNLSEVQLPSPEDLARQLLACEISRRADRFDLSPIRILPSRPAGGTESSSVRVGGELGDTLVIVRECRGVQVGDRNVQRNDFGLSAGTVKVRAVRLAMTPDRAGLIRRALAQPGDQGALRSLADDVIQAARDHVIAEATERIKDLADRDALRPPAARTTGERAVQHGAGNQARHDVSVELGERIVPAAYSERVRAALEKLAAELIPDEPGAARADPFDHPGQGPAIGL